MNHQSEREKTITRIMIDKNRSMKERNGGEKRKDRRNRIVKAQIQSTLPPDTLVKMTKESSNEAFRLSHLPLLFNSHLLLEMGHHLL
jgi:hypothetical protein